ncbi:MAG: serine/threonine-protein phosphatase [Planctomycetes bacterium]|nr:serine/threonine-protein phosphatase [Planctomycetota bacterium]
MRITHGTDRGPRTNLEDQAAAIEMVNPTSGSAAAVLGVFDGVGGRTHGEVAAEIGRQHALSAVAALATELLVAGRTRAPDDVIDTMGGALRAANSAVLKLAENDPSLRGMATTAVCGLVYEGMLYTTWVGDSRCYVYGQRGLRQVTCDHSEAQELVDLGLYDSSEVHDLPIRHIITRFLGQQRGFAPETRVVRLSPGDLILLCTDGMTDVLTDTEIENIIEACQAKEDVAGQLIQRSLDNGARDNVTALCCDTDHEGVHLTDHTLTDLYTERFAESLYHPI